MFAEENKALVRRWFAETDNGNLAIIDDALSADYVNPTTATGTAPGGAERYKQGVSRTRTAFPDIEVTFDSMIAEGDLVAYQCTWRGTHLGLFRGSPHREAGRVAGDLLPAGGRRSGRGGLGDLRLARRAGATGGRHDSTESSADELTPAPLG
jgi:predicted ester cyclase